VRLRDIVSKRGYMEMTIWGPLWVKLRRSQYEQMFSALPPIADTPGRDRRKLLLLERLLLSFVGQRIRTLCKLHRKLLRPPSSFQNCTKMTKYEAFERNVVSNRKLSSLRQSLVRSVTQKVSVCWGFWGWSTELDSRLPRLLAEGEELGSKLLHTARVDATAKGKPPDSRPLIPFRK
jgi:hypothetical protein